MRNFAIVALFLCSVGCTQTTTDTGVVVDWWTVVNQPEGDGTYTGPQYAVDVKGKRYYFNGRREVGETIEFPSGILEGVPYDFVDDLTKESDNGKRAPAPAVDVQAIQRPLESRSPYHART